MEVEKNLFLVTTCPGIEDIVEMEILEKLGKRKIQKRFGSQGRVLIKISDRKMKKLFNLKSIHHILKFLGCFKIRRSREGLSDIYDLLSSLNLSQFFKQINTFRITSERMGRHDFTSVEIQKYAGQAIVDKYKKKVDLKNFDLNLRVDVIGENCYVGIQLTKESLHKRGYRVCNHPAAIKPTLAYAMIKMVGIKKGEILVDPMCGGGTVPIEAALEYDGKIKVFGFDRSEKYIQYATSNAKAAKVSKYVRFKVGDCRRLGELIKGCDRVVTNPPYGVKMGDTKYVKSLYYRFLESVEKVLTEKGRMCLITLKAGMFRNIVFRQKGFKIVEERIVGHGGLYPTIFILEKM